MIPNYEKMNADDLAREIERYAHDWPGSIPSELIWEVARRLRIGWPILVDPAAIAAAQNSEPPNRG
jgi:hypothetical protein